MKRGFKITCSCGEEHDGLVFCVGNRDRIHCTCGAVWEVKLLDPENTDPTE